MGIRHHAALLVGTLVFTLLFWQFFGAKALATYLVYWMVFEVVYRLRKRGEFVCRNCGFDPFLYKSDAAKARIEVKNYLQNRILTEGHFRGKKLKNYQTQPSQADAAKDASAAAAAADAEEGADKTIVPMPKSPAERRAVDVRDEMIESVVPSPGSRKPDRGRTGPRP